MTQTFGYYASSATAQTLEQFTGSYLENWTNQNIWDFVAVVSAWLSSDEEFCNDLDDLRDAMNLDHDHVLEQALNIISGIDRPDAVSILLGVTSIAYAKNRH
jgi:hypothetical protein